MATAARTVLSGLLLAGVAGCGQAVRTRQIRSLAQPCDGRLSVEVQNNVAEPLEVIWLPPGVAPPLTPGTPTTELGEASTGVTHFNVPGPGRVLIRARRLSFSTTRSKSWAKATSCSQAGS